MSVLSHIEHRNKLEDSWLTTRRKKQYSNSEYKIAPLRTTRQLELNVVCSEGSRKSKTRKKALFSAKKERFQKRDYGGKKKSATKSTIHVSRAQLTAAEVEDLKRQRDELLRRKREKEEVLASLEPEDVITLRIQRESLLAAKKAKERELVQLLKKQDVVDKPSSAKKDKDRYAPIPPHLQGNILDETKKQYLELKKEHKQDRQLMKEQKERMNQVLGLREINSLQLVVNTMLEHYGLEPVPVDITDFDLEEAPETQPNQQPQLPQQQEETAYTTTMEVEIQ